MNVVRKLALGLLLAGTLTCVAVSAAPQTGPGGQPGGQREVGRPGDTPPPAPGGAFTRQDIRLSPHQWQSQPAQLAQQYAKAEKDEEKKEIRKKLTEVLNQQFDQHIQQQQKELDDLEKQIASLRAVLKKRLSSKTAIVERRFEQLVEDAEGLGWNAPSSLHRPAYGTVELPLANTPMPKSQ